MMDNDELQNEIKKIAVVLKKHQQNIDKLDNDGLIKVINSQANVIKKLQTEVAELKRQLKNTNKTEQQNTGLIKQLTNRMDKIDAYFSRRR